MKRCPACQAELPPGTITCAYCGSRVLPAAVSLTQRTAIQSQAAEWNDQLAGRIIRITWVVIGITSLLIFLIAALVYLLTLIMGLNLSWSLSLGMVLLMMTLFFATLIRSQTASRAASERYHQDISPRIQALAKEKSIPRWQLEAIIRAGLSEHCPLAQFLPNPQK